MNGAIALGVIALAVNVGSAGAADSNAHRFHHESNAREVIQSDDGRYTLSASAHFTPASQKSSNGRYALRALGANCESSSGALFRDGFENAP